MSRELVGIQPLSHEHPLSAPLRGTLVGTPMDRRVQRRPADGKRGTRMTRTRGILHSTVLQQMVDSVSTLLRHWCSILVAGLSRDGLFEGVGLQEEPLPRNSYP